MGRQPLAPGEDNLAFRNNHADPTNSETKNTYRIKMPRTPGGLPEPNRS